MNSINSIPRGCLTPVINLSYVGQELLRLVSMEVRLIF